MKTYYTRMRCIQKTVIVSCIMYISSVLYSDDTRKFLIYGGEKRGRRRKWGGGVWKVKTMANTNYST
jgi:hypothetical protein